MPILPLFRGAWSAAMLKVEVGKQLTPVDTEPRFTRELKAIRDKKERFLERKAGAEVVEWITESASVAAQEGPSLDFHGSQLA